MVKSCTAGMTNFVHPQESRMVVPLTGDNNGPSFVRKREAHVLYDYFTQRFAQAMNWPAVLGETFWSWG